MKVAVIIVNYNDTDDTVKYVKKITEYKCIQKIVIVDNCSTDENAIPNLKQLESSKVALIQSDKNGGYAYGNNLGVKYLENQGILYDYFIISNPDIDIEENAITRCLDILERDKDIAVTAPRMYDSNNAPIRRSSWKKRTFWLDVIHSTRLLEVLFYKKLRNGEYSNQEYENPELQVDVITGAFFIIKYDALKQIGYFDENLFLFYEEDIMAERLKENNYKIVSVNDVKFIHYESQSIGKTFSYYKKMRQLYKSKMYYQINYNKINCWQIMMYGFLNICRKIELLFEIPIRKILRR